MSNINFNYKKEQIELWFYLNKESLFGIIKVLILCVGTLYLVNSAIKFPRKYQLWKLDTESTAIIDFVLEEKGILETQEGGKVVTQNYKINYHYQVEGIQYEQVDNIGRLSVSMKQRVRLSHLGLGDTVLIRYNSNLPKYSKIDMK